MSNVVTGIARYLATDVEALDVVSQNVANMRTPGYRAERVAPDFMPAGRGQSLSLDMADGSLAQTGKPLDVAIEGPGFFVVDVNGQEMLTRNGQFHLDSDKQLVDAGGRVVQGESGPIVLSGDNVHIGADGSVVDGDRTVDQLRIFAIDTPDALREAGDGLYTYAGTEADWSGQLHQGAVEQSNVDPGNEMVRLMEITRHAQSVQRAIQAYDQALQTGINHLGDNS